MIRTLALLTLIAAPPFSNIADAAVVHICWQGSNGYTMTGRMEFADSLLPGPLVTETDITTFRITGYLEGQLLGKWDLADLTPTTTWYLRYDPVSMTFPTTATAVSATGIDQGWNANGEVTDCGSPGFGFNAANYAQDICLNGTWVEPSGVPPETPFKASTEAPYTPDCAGPALVSKQP